MSGVIDEKGRQWEHCNICGKLVLMNSLGYEKPSKEFKHGRDVCIDCVNKLTQRQIRRVEPAASWIAKRS